MVKQEVIVESTSPVFVISDLHIGDNSNRDNHAFNGREQLLNSFLDHVEKANGELVILGDLFEFVRCNLGKVLVSRKQLLDRFTALNATYVTGNHDMELAPLVGADMLMHPFFRNMSHPFVRTIGGRRFMFMHGHEVDPLNRRDDPGWSRIFGIFRGLLEERKGRPLGVHDSITEFCDRFRLRTKKVSPSDVKLVPAAKRFRRNMVRLYHAELVNSGHDAVVVGHTHRAGRCHHWYFNSGSWTGSTNDYLMIAPNGDVEIFHWTASGPVLNDRHFSH